MKPIRRAQALSPFGIGALVDFPKPESLVQAGLDAWEFDEKNHAHLIVRDDRLANRLGVDFFVLPPEYKKKSSFTNHEDDSRFYSQTIPFLKFPLWHFCRYCGIMKPQEYHHRDSVTCEGPYGTGKNENQKHNKSEMIQVRFVVACKDGHMQDFPWIEWLGLENWKPNHKNKIIRMRTTDLVGGAGVEIRAEEIDENGKVKKIGKPTTLAGVFGDYDQESPLTKKNIKCSGHNPALGVGENNCKGCGNDLYVMLRGSSSLYFADIKSSIYIPNKKSKTINSEIADLLDSSIGNQFKSELIQQCLLSFDGMLNEKVTAKLLKQYHPEKNINPGQLTNEFNEKFIVDVLFSKSRARSKIQELFDAQILDEGDIDKIISDNFDEWDINTSFLYKKINEFLSDSKKEEKTNIEEINYRGQEYETLSESLREGMPKENLIVQKMNISEYQGIENFIEHISLVPKLTETRAFNGYSRIQSKSLSPEERSRLISKKPMTWLPAIVVRGEGIFLKLNHEKLIEWENEFDGYHEMRLKNLNIKREKNALIKDIAFEKISPRFLLIHTLSHILINQLIYDCGYGSASLREKIYCYKDSNYDIEMYGFLIFTAAGDSEGTMGGLVKMGEKNYFESILDRAIKKAEWCSSDPICIESQGQGLGSSNLASCHACSLLPETSCEHQNQFLDRGVLVGTIDKPNSGFFSDF